MNPSTDSATRNDTEVRVVRTEMHNQHSADLIEIIRLSSQKAPRRASMKRSLPDKSGGLNGSMQH